MSWKFVGDAKGQEAIPGIPLACSDAEFRAAAAEYEAGFGPEAAGTLAKSGLYEHVSDKPAKAPEEA